ncbi:sigma-54-dependent Fis family transcriptional regulator [bacterium NHP-B]|nr:sigma-54-dependent Fis family transcriptional regulator [bacterium NHP-B]
MSVLVIGELGGFLTEASNILIQRGHKISHTETTDQALDVMRKGHHAGMILIDVSEDVAAFSAQLSKERFSPYIVACGLGMIDKEKVQKAIQGGAKEFVPFPPDPNMIADILDSFHQGQTALLFVDPLMQKTMDVAHKVSGSDASVLITGESGTGKEMMARYIHEHSKRKKNIFLSVNCAAIPEALLESELFGHEKGAFTGAVARRIGKFEAANGGTLLLDEISEMHPRLQAKLLRAIQEKEIDRVGGTHPVSVDFRLIATSNRDMRQAIHEGQFREDLYYRLSVIQMVLPPLRKRPGDLEMLMRHFMKKYADLNGVSPHPTLSPDTLAVVHQYDWPGNVRELENVTHRAVLMSDTGVIHPHHLGLSNPNTSSDPEVSLNVRPLVGETLANVEKELVLSTLTQCDQDSTRAAKLLGLSLRALQLKLHAYEADLKEVNDKVGPSP